MSVLMSATPRQCADLRQQLVKGRHRAEAHLGHQVVGASDRRDEHRLAQPAQVLRDGLDAALRADRHVGEDVLAEEHRVDGRDDTHGAVGEHGVEPRRDRRPGLAEPAGEGVDARSSVDLQLTDQLRVEIHHESSIRRFSRERALPHAEEESRGLPA
jgi:hypothetical protein